jgi:hypothetical protein
LRAIEFPPWLAREAHNWRTHAVSKARIFRLNEQRMVDRQFTGLRAFFTTIAATVNDLPATSPHGSDPEHDSRI